MSGGTAISAVVAAGYQQVGSGGTLLGTLVDSGGEQFVSGGTAISTTVASGAQYVYIGTASATSIDRGIQHISIGGIAISTIVATRFGEQDVGGGGSWIDAVISASLQIIKSGGIAVGTTIDGGASEFVRSGGAASGTTAEAGAAETVYASGTVIDDTIGSGAVIELYSGALVSGMTAVLSGGTLQIASGYRFGTASAIGGVWAASSRTASRSRCCRPLWRAASRWAAGEPRSCPPGAPRAARRSTAAA